MKPDLRYEYSDGSANRYIVTANAVEYDPVTPAESSTGTYSGGDPKTVSISDAQFEAIGQLFNTAVSNKSVHIKDRVKTSGAISIAKGNSNTQVILAPQCKEKQDIESFLKKILSE
jgi:hypothetical protein